MACYKVIVQPGAARELRSLSKIVQRRVFQVIKSLENNPLPYGVVKLSGIKNAYRVRIGDYRVVYEINKTARKVTVFRIRHRKDAYK